MPIITTKAGKNPILDFIAGLVHKLELLEESSEIERFCHIEIVESGGYQVINVRDFKDAELRGSIESYVRGINACNGNIVVKFL